MAPVQEAPTEVELLTAAERELVCRVVAAEARGEDLQGQMAVAQTILDRAVLWDMTVADVVTAPGQFAGPYQGEVSDSVKLAVANVFDGGMRVFDGGTYQFHDDSVNPCWTAGKIARGSIGRLSFYGGYAN
ncbi:MAG: cell wall hydrolase [Eubacteriales bacterium]|nr:cell wall hydrolase [Eubacteriales bacterium]